MDKQSNLSAFFRQNAAPLPTRELVVSDRFLDENGKPLKWKIRTIDAGTHEGLRSESMDMSAGEGIKDVKVRFNTKRFNMLSAAASVIYPDLKNTELQDSYGVKSDDALLGVMLSDEEFNTLLDAVKELGKSTAPEKLEENAKN